MAGRGAGAQLRAPLLEGSDLSPANATFRRGGKASPSPGRGMPLAGQETLVAKSEPRLVKHLQYGHVLAISKVSMITLIK